MAKARRNQVDCGTLISCVVRLAKLGKSNQDAADELGMSLPSFQSRSSAIRGTLAEVGKYLPCLGKRGRPKGGIKDVIASLDSDVLAALLELDAKGNPIPIPDSEIQWNDDDGNPVDAGDDDEDAGDDGDAVDDYESTIQRTGIPSVN